MSWLEKLIKWIEHEKTISLYAPVLEIVLDEAILFREEEKKEENKLAEKIIEHMWYDPRLTPSEPPKAKEWEFRPLTQFTDWTCPNEVGRQLEAVTKWIHYYDPILRDLISNKK